MKKTFQYVWAIALIGALLAGCEKFPPAITADQIASFSVPGGKATEENEAYALQIVNEARNASQTCYTNTRGPLEDRAIAELITKTGEIYVIEREPNKNKTFAVRTGNKGLQKCFTTENFDGVMASLFPKER